MKKSWLGLVLTTGLFLAPWTPAMALAPVTWTAPGVFLRVLLSTPATAALVQGEIPTEAITDDQVDCVANVMRPNDSEGQVKTSTNVINFVVHGKDGKSYALKYSLADAGIEAWGNRFDKPVHFSADDKTSTPLYEAMKQAVINKLDEKRITVIQICGPDGSCLEEFFMDRVPDTTAALACHREFKADHTIGQTKCDFLSL